MSSRLSPLHPPASARTLPGSSPGPQVRPWRTESIILDLVDGLGSPKQERHLGHEHLLLFEELLSDPVATHQHCPRSWFRPGPRPNPDHPGLLAHEQGLGKQGVAVLKMLVMERGNGPEVGTIVGRQPTGRRRRR